MKTLRFIAAILIISGFTSGNLVAQTTVQKFETNLGAYIPCTGEWAFGPAVFHQFSHYDKNGILLKSKDLIQGATLVGELSGTVFVGIILYQSSSKPYLENGAYHYTNHYLIKFIGKGRDAITFTTRLLFHVTINQNGEQTSYFDKYETFCE